MPIPSTTPALTAATPDASDPAPRRQRIDGVVTGLSDEAPTHGALGIAWVATVRGSESILDVRGLVLWPGTSIASGRSAGLAVGDRIRAWAREEEYWSIPPIFDATRIEVTGPGPSG